MEWHKEHPDALLDDMQLFLRTQCGLEVSLPTVSRQIRKAYGGTFLRNGRCARIRSRKQREAEGRSIALELQQPSGGDDNSSSNDNSGDHTPAPELYHDQRQLAPLEQILAPQHTPQVQDGQGAAYHHGGAGQQYQDAVSAN